MSTREFLSKAASVMFETEFAKSTAFLALIATLCFLSIAGRSVPAELQTIVAAIVGYYFRSGGANGNASN